MYACQYLVASQLVMHGALKGLCDCSHFVSKQGSKTAEVVCDYSHDIFECHFHLDEAYILAISLQIYIALFPLASLIQTFCFCF